MKLISIILISLIFHLNLIGNDEEETILFTVKEVNRLYDYVDSLEQISIINESLIQQQDYSLSQYRLLHEKDSLINSVLQQQLAFKDTQIQILNQTIVQIQPKWYDSPVIWFGMGVFLTLTAIKIK